MSRSAIAGAALGLAAFAVFWDGQARRVVEEGGIAAAVNGGRFDQPANERRWK